MSVPSSPKVVLTKERTVNTYAELWHASDCVLEAGIKNPEGSVWQFLSSAVLTAFAFEAYLNHVGAVTFECWEELDRLPTWSKLQLLCEKLGVHFEGGAAARPLQTVSKLLTFRNTMAHGRSSELRSKPIVRTVENYQPAHHEDLLADWERLIRTSDFAVRVREDVRAVLEAIHQARQDDDPEPLFFTGVGLYSATLERP